MHFQRENPEYLSTCTIEIESYYASVIVTSLFNVFQKSQKLLEIKMNCDLKGGR